MGSMECVVNGFPFLISIPPVSCLVSTLRQLVECMLKRLVLILYVSYQQISATTAFTAFFRVHSKYIIVFRSILLALVNHIVAYTKNGIDVFGAQHRKLY
ncbi:hypothetical protein BD769DRAFT_1418317 [Suillus cothurnatus]|nr:hypothetical protein BD769DRAFT_1418317 [Suillus cothurnatus]